MSDVVRLRLYVTGTSIPERRSREALTRLAGQRPTWNITIVDVEQHPEVIEEALIEATPTLDRLAPLPIQRFVGAIDDIDRVLAELDLATHD